MWTTEQQIKQQRARANARTCMRISARRSETDLKDGFKCCLLLSLSILLSAWFFLFFFFFHLGVRRVSPAPGCDAPNSQQLFLSSANLPFKSLQTSRSLHSSAWMLKHHTPAVILDLIKETRRMNRENIGLTLKPAQWICPPLDNHD